MVQNTSIYDYWKNNNFDYTALVNKMRSLIFNMLSRFVIAEVVDISPDNLDSSL